MSIKEKFSIISVAGGLIIIVYLIFYPSYYSRKTSLNGEVLIVWKPDKPRAGWLIELREQEKIRVVSYPFPNDIVTIYQGDSLRKNKNSNAVYLRKMNTDSWILLNRTVTIRN